MSQERREISKEEVVPELWDAYMKTDEFLVEKRIKSINSTHRLVREAEERGLKRVYNNFLEELSASGDLRDLLIKRTIIDWIDEWKHMHDILFADVYIDRGRFRRKGEDVYFGYPEDKERHRIPDGAEVQQEIVKVADLVSGTLSYVDIDNIDVVCEFLARVHYEFIRVHPFNDGNGRIARAIVDQLSVCLGYVPVLAGYPRTDEDVKKKYHAAINDCIGDGNRRSLSEWISSQMLEKLKNIA